MRYIQYSPDTYLEIMVFRPCLKELSLQDISSRLLLIHATMIVDKDGQELAQITTDSFKTSDGRMAMTLIIYELLNPTKMVTHIYTSFYNSLTPELEWKIHDILTKLFIKNGGHSGDMVIRTIKNLGGTVHMQSHM